MTVYSEHDVTVIPVHLSFKGFYHVGSFEPYAGGGPSYYFTSVKGGGQAKNVFGWHIVGGLNYFLDRDEGFVLGIEGKYLSGDYTGSFMMLS